jgi:ABC-type bacteriocin/lantibiotic exporter with double-glycine peptidase domain
MKVNFSKRNHGDFNSLATLRLIRSLMNSNDQAKVVFVTLIQIALSVLDLISVALIGLLTALTLSGIQSKQPEGTVARVLSELGLENFTFQQQAALLGIAAGVLIILKTVFSLLITRKLLLFLNLRGAQFSSEIIHKLLRQPILVIQEKTIQHTIFLVTSGVGAITNGVIATSVALVADSALLVVMIVGLSLVNPLIAFVSLLAFSALGLGLFQILKGRAASLAVNDANWGIESNKKLAEVLSSYREATVKNRRKYYADLISGYRFKMARAQVESMFIPSISKYVVEMALVLGSLCLAASQFLLYNATQAIATLSIFLAAGTRVAPAILRLQQAAVSIKSNAAVAGSTLLLWQELNSSQEVYGSSTQARSISTKKFSPNLSLKSVSFVYPDSDSPVLKDINLDIREGEMLAIAGQSGSGKSTLVDLMLGVLEPTTGSILLSGIAPAVAIEDYAGQISYVPQDVLIVDGSVRQNVALGFEDESIDDEKVLDAIRMAQLDDFIASKELGINHLIGERGTNLSGGQRQRLGLARALYTQPKILILDEATSALDGQTEANVTEMLLELRGSITLIVIAHRLSTIKGAGRIIYLEDGKIVSEGDFKKVESEVPGFGEKSISTP